MSVGGGVGGGGERCLGRRRMKSGMDQPLKLNSRESRGFWSPTLRVDSHFTKGCAQRISFRMVGYVAGC